MAIQASATLLMQHTFTRGRAVGSMERTIYAQQVQRVCVFCGSSPGARPEYTDATEDFGQLLVEQGVTLVFGGATVGLMGRLADTVLSEGGEAIGVIPQSLVEREIAHLGLTDLHVVDTMHERKQRMADLADAFVALPGGLGTLDELFEIYTWAQLGMHRKPIGIVNVGGYFDGLLSFLEHAVDERFVREDHRAMLIVESDPAALLERLQSFDPAAVTPKWIDREDV
jgi:uncharacterized protein (TIGR00730 family)